MTRSSCLPVLIAVLLCIHSVRVASKAGPPSSAQLLNDIPPPPATENNGQTHVYASATILNLGRVDGVNQEVSAELTLTLFWCDIRLANSSYFNSFIHWVPSIVPVNARPNVKQTSQQPFDLIESSRLPIQFGASDPFNPTRGNPCQTWATANLKYVGSFFIANLELHEFPFDKQWVTVYFEPALYSVTSTQLLPLIPLGRSTEGDADSIPNSFTTDPTANSSTSTTNAAGTGSDPENALTGNSDALTASSTASLQLAEWKFIDSKVYTGTTQYAVGQTPFSRITFAVELKRAGTYYFFKIIIPSIFICCFSIAFHALQADKIIRISSSVRAFSGIVALVFVSSNILPKLPYLTRLDKFMAWNYIFCVAIATVQYHWHLLNQAKVYFGMIGCMCGLKKEKEAAKPTPTLGSTKEKGSVEMTIMDNVVHPASGVKAAPKAVDKPTETGKKTFWQSVSTFRRLDLLSALLGYAVYAAGAVIVFVVL